MRKLRPELFIAILLLTSASAWSAPVILDRTEASVNSGLILLSDVKKFRETLPLRQQLDPLFSGTSIAAKGTKASDSEIVDFLINEKIVAQQFPITDAEVEQEINSIQATNRIDRNALKNALKEQGYKFEDYFELIRSSSAKRNLIDREIRTRVTISDDDVKNYFYNHYTRGTTAPQAYHVKIITISPKTFKTQAAAKEAIGRALKDIREGESFEEVARRASDHGSAASGGDLGVLTYDQMSSAIRDELKKMAAGQVSGVLGNARSGYFILKLADVKSSDSDRFEKVKEEIRGQLAAGEYQHQVLLWLERQRQAAFIHRSGQPSKYASDGT